MTTTLEEANETLRNAVRTRLDATPKNDPKMLGYVSQPETEPRDIGASTEEMSQDTHGYDAETLRAAKRYMDAYNLRKQVEAERMTGDGLLKPDVHPTSQAFFDLCDALKEMHRRKSRDYGCPSGEDPLANIRNGAKFVGIPSWKGAMVRLSDKVTRLASYNATGRLENESLEDNLFDLASYSLLALLLHREERDA
jgi:hypothetical protein